MRFGGAVAVVAVLSVLVTGAGTALGAPDPLTIEVLSNRADLVSGGDALVEVTPPRGVDAAQIAVTVDGRDVTPLFAVRPDGRYMALLDGLNDGENVVSASAPGATAASITITSHPIGGPVTAGTQIKPWACFDETARRAVQPAARVRVLLQVHRGRRACPSTTPPTRPRTSRRRRPTRARRCPYIVRQETGSIDRDEYRIASLYDPSKPWAPWAPQDGYNHKLVVFHGASCDTAYEQADAPDVLNETALVARLRDDVARAQQRRAQLQHLDAGRVDDHDQGAGRRAARRDPLHDRQRLLGRRAGPAAGRQRLPRLLPGHHAGLQLHRRLVVGDAVRRLRRDAQLLREPGQVGARCRVGAGRHGRGRRSREPDQRDHLHRA